VRKRKRKRKRMMQKEGGEEDNEHRFRKKEKEEEEEKDGFERRGMKKGDVILLFCRWREREEGGALGWF